jgi:hypothetical protein
MATKTWTQMFGANATFGSDAGGVFIKFYIDSMTNTGATSATINNANGAEKAAATLIKYWAALTYDETNNVTVAENFTALNVVQRNGSAKWTKGYDINLYAAATGIPTTIDPDDV